MLLSELPRAPIGRRLIRTDFDDDTPTLGLATTNPNASRPVCGHETWRVQSRYDRHLAEAPIFGHRVCLLMTVRRSFGSGSGCPRRLVTEPLDGCAAKPARTTRRPAQTHRAIASASGGEAGARRAGKTAVPTSPDTLSRRVKRAGARPAGAPRCVGLDDRAWCQGRRHGASVVDLETHDVIDLLPDRDAATVGTWLEAHPGIERVSRDRSSTDSQAASEAASQARQVADRWPLSKGVREAIGRVFERHRPVITEALKPADPAPTTPAGASSCDGPDPAISTEPVRQGSLPVPTPVPPRQEAALAERRRRVGRCERVHGPHRPGMPIRQIARELDMSRKSVRRYLRRERCPDWRPGRATRSGLDAHREWVDARIAEGRIDACE